VSEPLKASLSCAIVEAPISKLAITPIKNVFISLNARFRESLSNGEGIIQQNEIRLEKPNGFDIQNALKYSPVQLESVMKLGFGQTNLLVMDGMDINDC
jgi:hypothetical protein